MYAPTLGLLRSIIPHEERLGNFVKIYRSRVTMESGETSQACKMILCGNPTKKIHWGQL